MLNVYKDIKVIGYGDFLNYEFVIFKDYGVVCDMINILGIGCEEIFK